MGCVLVAGAGCLSMLCCGGILLRSLAVLNFSFNGDLTGVGPATALKNTTGLILPNRARIVKFEYVNGLDDYLSLVFDAPKSDVLAFAKQKPFGLWERHAESRAVRTIEVDLTESGVSERHDPRENVGTVAGRAYVAPDLAPTDAAYLRRRRIRAARPEPIMARVAGSGTGVIETLSTSIQTAPSLLALLETRWKES